MNWILCFALIFAAPSSTNPPILSESQKQIVEDWHRLQVKLKSLEQAQPQWRNPCSTWNVVCQFLEALSSRWFHVERGFNAP